MKNHETLAKAAIPLRPLELLAPAKNLECGIAAIDHGADAVYIGAPEHGARQAVGNSLEDIAKLCDYAHRFDVSVYVTVNTIIYENELDKTVRMVEQLAGIGADAVLLQDFGLLQRLRDNTALEKFPTFAFHASTQCDTRSSDKVRWLKGLGFNRVVLARELSLATINSIHQANPDIELEAFVHGSLCVSYSGVCYASQHCFHRSANRGECAQFCRLKFDLLDSAGQTVVHDRYLLSLKDMCRIDRIEELAEAGVTSFKIEGRLKDVVYVKNVVSAYARRLDKLVSRYPEKYYRASCGKVVYHFVPTLDKTFNRGFTDYFLDERKPDIENFNTPKALGEYVGKVKEVGKEWFTVAGIASFSNGDGLCFLNGKRELEGLRINRVVSNKLFPWHMSASLRRGMDLYRNNNESFQKTISGNTAERKIPLNMVFGITEEGFSLAVSTELASATATVSFPHQAAEHPQHENIIRQLSKLGNTPFVCTDVQIQHQADHYFIPSSLLATLRRNAIERIEKVDGRQVKRTKSLPAESNLHWQPEYSNYPYLYNIANTAAKAFYKAQGLEHVVDAFEVGPVNKPLIMQCRHCLRYALGHCVRYGGVRPTWHEPLFLQLPDKRRFRLEFNCRACQMNVYAE